MIKTALMILAVILAVLVSDSSVLAESTSIYEIQYTTDPDGDSPLNGELIDECSGGIVTCVFPGSRTRIVVQDTNYPDGWGAIEVKDIDEMGYLDNISIGDDVRIFNATVEEYRGTTFLQMIYWDDPEVVVISSGNPVPEPLVVDVNEIAAPVYDPGGCPFVGTTTTSSRKFPPRYDRGGGGSFVGTTNYPPSPGDGGYFVVDHSAEKYEAMLLRVENVVVTDMGLGKASDNYVLQDYDNPDDPNFSCWASDYLNNDKDHWQLYHPYVIPDQRFCSVTGILEQYTRLSYGWDYYQLLTTYTGDLKRYTPADLNGDCMVDFSDFAVFCQYWLWGTE